MDHTIGTTVTVELPKATSTTTASAAARARTTGSKPQRPSARAGQLTSSPGRNDSGAAKNCACVKLCAARLCKPSPGPASACESASARPQPSAVGCQLSHKGSGPGDAAGGTNNGFDVGGTAGAPGGPGPADAQTMYGDGGN